MFLKTTKTEQKAVRESKKCVWCGGPMRENETGYQCCGYTWRKKFDVPVNLSTMPQELAPFNDCGL